MIFLITGASYIGKTFLAQKMLEKYKISYLSIDHLKMGLIRSKQTDLTPKDDDKLTTYLWPIVKEIIKTAIENKQNLIVEGGYVPFNFRKDFDKNYLDEINFICLAMTDNYIDNHFDDIVFHSEDVEKRLYNQCNIEDIKIENKKVINGFKNAGEKIVMIDNSYIETINLLLQKYIC